ncbi:hypothetical protein ALP48_200101 [Pseudomonas syringae pv. solidagae]|uniref:Uncharacterized protein n=1 Tax=Pseudomonas syringae pv. solidagae TaxID=264458 RepID=A0A3M5KTP1_PSESX|nr:hypothetical protein ALP48_200101 [Pseudomonas syringae pv. solidagae]
MALIVQPFRHSDFSIDYLRGRVPDDIRSVIVRTETPHSLNSLNSRNHHEAKAAFEMHTLSQSAFFNKVCSDDSGNY